MPFSKLASAPFEGRRRGTSCQARGRELQDRAMATGGRSGLEGRLAEDHRVFVAEITGSAADSQHASFAGECRISRCQGHSGDRPLQSAPSAHGTASPRGRRAGRRPGPVDPSARRRRRARRQTRLGSSEGRELGDRLVPAAAASSASEPMGVRALSSELGVATDLLAAPLLELRASGRIAKHGEKRATTYTVA